MRDLQPDLHPIHRRIPVLGIVDATAAQRVCDRIDASQGKPLPDLLVDLDGVELLPARSVRMLDGAVSRAHERDLTVTLVAREGSVARRVLDVLANLRDGAALHPLSIVRAAEPDAPAV